jgi:hypothetical protein
VCLLLGLLFQWAAKLYAGERRTLAAAYAVEKNGTQSHAYTREEFVERYQANFGPLPEDL